ncbi:MAG: guanylate kinase [Bacteriovoracaceae bacterium]|nr:guanylate kinase [Bacteriovoracaceae bacterium]
MDKTQNQGRLIVICAPSGTGKSTLLAQLKKEHPELHWSVSCTTRPMRAGETNAVDYHYISKEDFEKRIASNDFIEWARVHSNYYGTSKTFVDQGIQGGKALLFDLDVQGADAMKKIYGDGAKVIFIRPPSIDDLEKRLRGRATDSIQVVEERLKNARVELTRANDYDFLVTNDDFERAYQDLAQIVAKILKGH